jgi:N-methylhydantoinase A
MAVRPTGQKPDSLSERSVYLSNGEHSAYKVFVRENLMAGDEIAGPAVIAEHTATTVIHLGDQLTVGAYGELVIEISQGE